MELVQVASFVALRGASAVLAETKNLPITQSHAGGAKTDRKREHRYYFLFLITRQCAPSAFLPPSRDTILVPVSLP
jgi:hypothetical protein